MKPVAANAMLPAAKPQRSLTPWQLRALEHGELDFLLPRNELLMAWQVAQALGVDKRSVHRLCEEGRLETWRANITGKRGDYRITRRSVRLELLRHWELPPEEFARQALELVRSVGDVALLRLLRTEIDAQIARRQP